ncbi:hypothetical protein HZB01_01745 [Candidatus Woesearchaeota archaeon]|nr:hypothetical protein [Candidatus Woesearchaeota archaeon]
MLKRTSAFPLEPVKDVAKQFNKAFHAKLFTLFASSVSEVHTFSSKVTPHYNYCFCFIKEDEGKWFLEQEGIVRVRQWVLEQCKKGTHTVDEIYRKWETDWDAYLSLLEQITSRTLQKASDPELLALFKDFYAAYLKAGSVAYICDSFMSLGDQDWLVAFLKAHLPLGTSLTDAEHIITTLTSPVHLSFMLESEDELLHIAARHRLKHPLPLFEQFSRKHPLVMHDLIRHAEKFHWIQNNYYTVKRLSAENFYDELRVLLGKISIPPHTFLAKKIDEKEQLLAEKEKLLSLYEDDYPKQVIKTARLFSKWKDERKAGVYRGMYFFDLFLEEISNRSRYKKQDLFFALPDELAKIISGEDLHEAFKQRKKQVFFAVTPAGFFIASGIEADAYFACLKPGSHASTEMRGVCACKGKAQGRVRIIRNAHDMSQFQVGEILVTNQTTPEFVPVMKKAAAIITEQGGITSHAAVIARELKVPCIIGTKIATSALQTGESVLVDAEKGIVRRLR